MAELRRTLDEKDQRLATLQAHAQSLERVKEEAEARQLEADQQADSHVAQIEALQRRVGAMEVGPPLQSMRAYLRPHPMLARMQSRDSTITIDNSATNRPKLATVAVSHA